MAAPEDPAFGGLGSADAITAAANAIAGIKADMASIERSAKKTADSMAKVGKSTLPTATADASGRSTSGQSASASTTGHAEPAQPESALGKITSALGGPMAAVGFAAAGLGAITTGPMRNVPVFGGADLGLPDMGMGTGALAIGGFRDLRVTADEALNIEAATLRFRMGTGEGRQAFAAANTGVVNNALFVQDHAQAAALTGNLTGQYGLTGGQVANVGGDYMTLASLSGMDQGIIGSAYGQMYGAPQYYGALGMGVMTYNPATGEEVPIADIVNQVWNSMGLGSVSPEQAAEEIRKGLAPGSAMRKSLEVFGPENAQMIMNALLTRAESGGGPLTSGEIAEAAEEAGYTEDQVATQAKSEAQRSRGEMVLERSEAASEGIADFNDELTKAQEYLRDLEGPAADAADAATRLGTALDEAAANMPKTWNSMTSAATGVMNLLGEGLATLFAAYLGGRVAGGFGRGGGILGGRGGGRGGGGGGRHAAPGRAPGIVGRGGGLLKGGLVATGVGVGANLLEGALVDQEDDLNFGEGALMVGTRAATGAAIGSMFGPLGTGLGAVVGSLWGLNDALQATAGNEEERERKREESRRKAEQESGGEVYWHTTHGWQPVLEPEVRDNVGRHANQDRPGRSGGSTSGSNGVTNRDVVGRSKGDWFVEKDQVARIHYGEMVLPNRVAQAVRDELSMGQVSPIAGDRRGRQSANVTINLTVQHASDAEAMRFARTVKRVIDGDHELASIGAGRLA